ncbi:glycosyltransferase (activator-dependent family) [Streptosporangium becharense]|uniref:Glycosyltransferase (Activator-dependent family) n=1 Tax=Streptosporangium becharense TaxID=1816182 RepID=A0A7W9IDF1_9ACTN|nr:activator-dependent family glycosyltransferase [Streptosporangium becharense]MBB2915620.1 glycosyltransferase (activator-dependent family) [Streptosporangium becharense]MBB5818108.1 glycosyltransferase (activator-dependent family) [Streptosporangium becharense]
MRVLFTLHAATAHLFLVVPIAWALRAAGHEVIVATQPDIVEEVTRTGLTALPVGQPSNVAERLASMAPEEHIFGSGFDIAEERPEVLTYEYVRDCMAAFASPLALDLITDESMYDDLVAFCRQWRPDLVVWDSITFPGPVAAHACGAAHVRSTFGRDHWGRMRSLFLSMRDRQPGDVREDPVADWVTAKLARYGLPFHEDAILGQATVDSMPLWTRFPVEHHYLPVRFVPYNGPAVIPDWLREAGPDRPRVCFTLGVSGREMWGGHGSIRAADLFDAVADLDVEVVATLKANQLDPDVKVPDNVRIVDYVPLNALLPSCSAIVHHGGTGTFGTAIAHGVPQLVVPAALYDEAGMARQIAEQGAGLVVDPTDLSTRTLRENLVRLIGEPSFRENATRLRRVAQTTPAPRDLVCVLEDLVARHRAGGPRDRRAGDAAQA